MVLGARPSHRVGRGLAARVAAVALLATTLAGCAARRPPEPASPAPPAPEPRPVKVALVLGGGGARGFAHVGVIRVLEQEKIPIDMIVGASAGSLIGALYADARDSFELESIAWQVEKDDLFDWSLLGSARGPVTGKALEDFVARHVKAPTIERLGIPFVAVATDLKTGGEVVLDRGPVGPAIHASSAIPGVFRPVQLDGRSLVDAGVVDPVPVSVARARGADVVIAVDIGMELAVEEPGNIASISLRCIVLLAREIARIKAREADVLISPKVGETSSFDFSRKKDLMAAGVAAAREAVPAIREAIVRASLRPAPVSSHSP
jgi:NTE family protein